MKDGISGAPLPQGFPYKDVIEALCAQNGFFPCLVGAIKMNETGLGQGVETETDVSFDNGRGIMQLTSSYPDDWQDPTSNISYAIEHFLVPAYEHWKSLMQGDDLVRCIAATYNAGLGNAEAGHDRGDVDRFTTNDYASRALAHYQSLCRGEIA